MRDKQPGAVFRARCARTSAQAAPAFAIGGVPAHAAAARGHCVTPRLGAALDAAVVLLPDLLMDVLLPVPRGRGVLRKTLRLAQVLINGEYA